MLPQIHLGDTLMFGTTPWRRHSRKQQNSPFAKVVIDSTQCSGKTTHITVTIAVAYERQFIVDDKSVFGIRLAQTVFAQWSKT